jgi:RNA recognition motif-containing protein
MGYSSPLATVAIWASISSVRSASLAVFCHVSRNALSEPEFHKEEYLMNKKLYVGNMPYETTQDQIRTLFAEAGEVTEVNLITDRETGRLKGFGFVEMATEDGGREAIKRFNGHAMGERTLTVNEARPREDRSSRSFGGSRGRF